MLFISHACNAILLGIAGRSLYLQNELGIVAQILLFLGIVINYAIAVGAVRIAFKTSTKET